LSTSNHNGFRGRVQRTTALIEEAQRFPDPKIRRQLEEIVQGILDLHGVGIERMLDKIATTGDAGLALIDSLAEDELVGNLLLLYGLHPQELETRIRQALDKVRPYLGSHGGDVELLSVTDGTVRLRLQGSCHGCPSSAITLKQAIEEAVYVAAPDLTALEVEGVVESSPHPRSAFVPLGALQNPSSCDTEVNMASVPVLPLSRAELTGGPLPISGGEEP
jgi:Fe-S cluster biogenesis protein NfuA